jgi:hypothetical protein
VTRRALFLAVLAAIALPGAAQAALQPVFGLRGIPNPPRGYFIYTLARGASLTGAVLVTNNGKAAGTVRIYAADGTTGATTGTVYLTDRKPVRAGSWITMQRNAVTLAPGGHEVVHFTVRVPKTASPGQWVAGIVAETSNIEKGKRTKSKASVQVRIRSQTILAVQVNVPGPPRTKFTIGAASAGGTHGFQQVLIHVANLGNMLAKPHGVATVVSAGGKVVETLPFQMDTFLPETSVDYPVTLKKALAAGRYTVNVTLSTPGATVTAHPALTVSPQNVQQVFTTSQPTQAAPPAATTAAAPPVAGHKSGASPLAILVIAIGGLVLLSLMAIFWAILRRDRPNQA